MLIILAFCLLPIAILAIIASLNSARENMERAETELRGVLSIAGQRLDAALARGAITVRAASEAVEGTDAASRTCERTLERLGRVQGGVGRYALYAPGNRLRCASAGYVQPDELPAARVDGSGVGISRDGSLLVFALYDGGGSLEGVGSFSREGLARLVQMPEGAGANDLHLLQGGRNMALREEHGTHPIGREIVFTQPVADGQLHLRIAGAAVPLSASELLMVLLPIVMLLAAAVIGWWVIHRLLLRPLVRMQRVVSAYQPGDRSLPLPSLRSPAREIGELGLAFDQVTRTVARHEAELEAAVERQTRLVREVHHRVKNNLQVVASLLNLHARGSQNEEVAAAYASIQRRVDALAVVHRNHYAELEENRGVALKPLISELAANLRATAPSSASHMQIRLDIEPFYVTQDVAVSVAFLLTELVEFGMFCGASSVAIALEGAGPASARLTIESESLFGRRSCDEKLFDRFDRIVTGLARQLRSSLDRDLEQGRYSILLTVVDKAER